ncbi:MAG: DNA translocase FtsK, partial [Clostridia bacterium]|nr:DNA translocase FtsK [Clostridia bacterium]
HAQIEGQDACGIEIPNKNRDIIGLKSILCSKDFNKDSKGLKFAMGKDLEGAPYVADITKMPHMLVAGSTGTGKSVFLNAVLTSLLFKYSPDDLRMVLIDPKKVELTVYRNLPNLLIKEPVKESKHAVNALRWLCQEMDRRYDFFSKVGCSNIQDYNDLYRKPDEPKMYRILLVIDEMADLMINSRDSNVEDYIVRIAQLARACGIHMIIATQRPTVKVITGLIKSNIIHRVAFAVKTNTDSRVILDDGGAEELLGNGDMLYSKSDGMLRLQGAFAHISEIKAVCDYIRENNECEYDESIAKAVSYEPPKPETAEERSAAREEERDAEFEKQLQIILKSFIKTGRASVSSAQAAHHVGYIKAKKLVDAMTERGFIGPEDGAKPREILITMEEWEDLFGENASQPVAQEEYDEE